MIKRKFWKTGVAIAVVLLMQTDVAVYAVNTDGEVQVTQESNITQDGNAAAVIEEKNLETADAEADSTETDSAEENVTEDVLTVEYDAEMPAPAAEEKQVGWKKEDDGWYYYNNDGSLKTGWLQLGETYYYLDGNDPEHPGRMACDEKKTINGYNYFFNTSGAMQTGWIRRPEGWYYAYPGGNQQFGWLQIGNNYYYLDKNDEYSGRMTADEKKTINGYNYFFEGGGVMQTGWVKRPEGWYYAYPGGDQRFGWVKTGGYWYYLDQNNEEYPGLMANDQTLTIGNTEYVFKFGGAMYTGWRYISGEGYYYYDENSGQKISGWKSVNGNWYYLDPSNNKIMVSNSWKQINGYWYYFVSSGEMAKGWKYINGNYYYLSNDGVMRTGWQDIDGYRYYFYKENEAGGWGVMAHDTTINSIRIDSSGHAKMRVENYKKGNLCQFLGIDGRKYYNFLKTHISDKTYIGTKYSKNSYKDGANGFSGWVNSAGAGMDCEGFIDNVLKQCGASHPMSVGGGGKGWVAYNNHYGLPYYDYSSKADMLASGILDYGDIIWMFDTSGPNSISSIHHIGIFVGSNPYEDKLWHSTFAMSNQYGETVNGNQVSRIVPQASGCKVWRVIKSGAIITP